MLEDILHNLCGAFTGGGLNAFARATVLSFLPHRRHPCVPVRGAVVAYRLVLVAQATTACAPCSIHPTVCHDVVVGYKMVPCNALSGFRQLFVPLCLSPHPASLQSALNIII